MDGQISSGRDLRNAYDFIDLKIKKPLERLPGVAEVEIWGVSVRKLRSTCGWTTSSATASM